MAAFMQEIELEHGLPTKGKDQRGIERLRSLALKMKEFSKVSDLCPSSFHGFHARQATAR